LAVFLLAIAMPVAGVSPAEAGHEEFDVEIWKELSKRANK
jgi:hypothetical protein